MKKEEVEEDENRKVRGRGTCGKDEDDRVKDKVGKRNEG